MGPVCSRDGWTHVQASSLGEGCRDKQYLIRLCRQGRNSYLWQNGSAGSWNRTHSWCCDNQQALMWCMCTTSILPLSVSILTCLVTFWRNMTFLLRICTIWMKRAPSLVVVGSLIGCGIFFHEVSGITWRDKGQVLSLSQQSTVLLLMVQNCSHALYLQERMSSMMDTLRRTVFCKWSALICKHVNGGGLPCLQNHPAW